MPALEILARKKRKKPARQLPLELAKNYALPIAAQVIGVHVNTLWRAVYSDNLITYRIGRRRVVSGEQLKKWLDAGGKTSRTGVSA
ncbi:MAG: helix-turn-helix domain-containing protein [Acidobacteriota bacterium]|nr:helix-turn-helix domain-containing protein [Acidobacteriota bacterium]